MRIFSVLAGAALLAWALAPLSAQVASPLPPVITTSGAVAGQTLASGVKAWIGIPYAKPPTANLRWQPPQPIHWNGVFNADRRGAECLQAMRAHTMNQYFGDAAQGEDCLSLNIWAPPGANANAKLPVVFFLHGGGNTVGSGSLPEYWGEKFAARGGVLVTINYRLRVLGSLAHPELSKEQGGRSGNYAYYDMLAALKWVQANIARFGGDPAHVAVFGNSSGGTAVFELMMSPLAKGLFSAAVMDAACPSLGGQTHLFCAFHETPLAEAEAGGAAFQKDLGAADLAALRETAADKLLPTDAKAAVGVIDGALLPRRYQETIKAHLWNDVPLLFTNNANDTDWTRDPFTAARTVAGFKAIAAKVYGAKAGEFLALYPVTRDSDVPGVVAHVAVDMGLQQDAHVCAATLHRFGGKSDMFFALYAHKEPVAAGIRYTDPYDFPSQPDFRTDPKLAAHNFDTPYWLGGYEAFNIVRHARDITEVDRQLSSDMSDMLIAFAARGNPSTAKATLRPWAPGGREERVVLDHQIRVEPMPVKQMDWMAANPVPGAGPACDMR